MSTTKPKARKPMARKLKARKPMARKLKADAVSQAAPNHHLNWAIHEIQMARAMALCLERSAVHEFIRIGTAADGAAAIVVFIDRALEFLDSV